jgi:L-rhamnose mutarotase
MKCFAQTLELVDDPVLIAEYKAWHRAVWPEVVRGLRAIGIERMRIFLFGTRLFMVVETTDTFDLERDYQRYAADPRTREWDERMRRYQRRVSGAPEGAWWTPMEQIFELESSAIS